MGVLLASEKWLNYWDGLPEHCWRAEHETNLGRKEVQVRLKRLAQQTSAGGYVLRGSFGTGKRELVRAAFLHVDSVREPTWVSGSHYGSEKPYGAIHFLLTGLDDTRLDSPLAVYGYLKQHFEALGELPLLIVEHVWLIDPLTTAVLSQLVSNSIIKMVVIDDLVEPLSEDFATLVRGGLMEVFQLNELTLNEARIQISMMLDLNVSYLTAIRLWTYTAGSSEALRAVVLDCREVGMFVVKGDSAALRSEKIPRGVHMTQHAADRLERLSLRQRMLLESLAIAGDLPEGIDGAQQDIDIDFLHARGLLERSGGEWKIVNPAIAQTLISPHGEASAAGWEEKLPQYASEMPTQVARNARHLRTSCLPDLGAQWQRAKSKAMSQANQGSNDAAIEIITAFQSKHPENRDAPNDELGADQRDAQLLLLELCLAASRLEEAARNISALEPLNTGGQWAQLNLCQQYHVLALMAEYHSRTNEHQQAEEILQALLEPLNHGASELIEYRFSTCMGASLRSMINTTLSLGKWEYGRRLIQLILAGSLPDLQLIAYAESVHAVMLAFAGNFSEAQKIIAPLQLQVRQSGTRVQGIFIDSVDRYVAQHSGHSSVQASHNRKTAELEARPVLGLECLWQTLQLVSRRFEESESQEKSIEQLALWAEERGEKLTASHLWATVIRFGGFHVAPRLRRLQDGHNHDFAVAFRMLSHGAQHRDPHLLATAVGSLAALGFVAYATDDGAAIFQFMNAGQRRRASRRANNFMMSLQPDLIRPDVSANLGRLTVLTEREKFVASAAASGLSNIEIAEQARVSVRTVEGHLYQVYSKLGISRRGELCALTATQRELDVAR